MEPMFQITLNDPPSIHSRNEEGISPRLREALSMLTKFVDLLIHEQKLKNHSTLHLSNREI